MAGLTLKELVEAIATAVGDAQAQVQFKQLENFREFFDDNNRPRMLELRVPDMRSDAKPNADALYRVPLVSLVHSTPLRITDATFEFRINLGTLVDAAGSKKNDPDVDQQLTVDTVTSDDGAHASVSLRVTAGDPPEGMQRLLTDLASMQGVFKYLG